MLKKLLGLMVVLGLVLGVVGCQDETKEKDKDTDK